ncbi:DUF397 domain-containing protein [Streptomyces sp. CA2R101]
MRTASRRASALRDRTNAPHGPAPIFDATAWSSFVTAVKKAQLPDV